MSPSRTSKDGTYRFDRTFRGVGRIQVSSGTRKKGEFHRRNGILTKLYEQGKLDLLRGVQAGEITMAELVDADRREALATVRADHLVLRRPLWTTAESALGTLANVGAKRYRESIAALRASGALPDRAKVSDLAGLDWRALEASWGRSAADWNHLRRAVSRLLTVLLESHAHPFRLRVLRHFPTRREEPREPDLSPDAFKLAVSQLEPAFQPYVWALAYTGMRPGELFRGTPDDLMPLTLAYRIRRRAKNRASFRIVELDPDVYRMVAACLPPRFTQDRVLRAWGRACERAGIPHTTLHDLRHCFAQWAIDAGVMEGDLQKQLGHLTPAMTRRYQMRKQRRSVTAAVAAVLGVPQSAPQPDVRKEVKRGA